MDVFSMLEVTNVVAKYPFLEKIVFFVVTYVLAKKEVKKNFKGITEGLSNMASALKLHQESNEKRFTNIETHIGLSKPNPITIPREE